MDAITRADGETLPLFVMDVVLPMQHMILNIFEPRYRLMVCLYAVLFANFSRSGKSFQAIFSPFLSERNNSIFSIWLSHFISKKEIDGKD